MTLDPLPPPGIAGQFYYDYDSARAQKIVHGAGNYECLRFYGAPEGERETAAEEGALATPARAVAESEKKGSAAKPSARWLRGGEGKGCEG